MQVRKPRVLKSARLTERHDDHGQDEVGDRKDGADQQQPAVLLQLLPHLVRHSLGGSLGAGALVHHRGAVANVADGLGHILRLDTTHKSKQERKTRMSLHQVQRHMAHCACHVRMGAWRLHTGPDR
jgi:hypothetical protein